LPLGGFVKIKGETENGLNDPDSIHSKPVWQRLVIIAAGVFMNWVLAVLIFTGIFAFGTRLILDGDIGAGRVTDRAVLITNVLKDSPAEHAGLKEGDELVQIGGSQPANIEEVKQRIQANGEKELAATVKREGSLVELNVVPQQIKEIGTVGVGIGMADIGTVSFSLPQAFVAGVKTTWNMTIAIVMAFIDLFRDLVTKREVSQDVSGPVGIAVMTGRVAQQGLIPLLQFAAMLSVNLAVINFLPIPALDGGRAVFLILEAIRRKPISRRLEIAVHNIAFLVLILLILVVSVRDVSRYGGVIWGGLKGIVGI